MNRNVESHFSTLPHADIKRSQFDRSHRVLTSFNIGEVIPFYVDEVLPGDTFNVSTSKVVRMQTLKTPMMDNIYLDTYYFFVPNRLVWEHWKEFNGENTKSSWYPTTEYEIPQLIAHPDDGFSRGSIADYMGIPVDVPGLSVNALPFRAYALICNEWFRDQNLTDPLYIPSGDSAVESEFGENYITETALGGRPFIASKYHDYFTSALPSPQKGPDVVIPVSTGANYPVVPLADTVSENLMGYPYTAFFLDGGESGGSIFFDSDGFQSQSAINTSSNASVPIINNLWAINDGTASLATINQLRLAFQIQKLYEKDARGGTRYTEILRSHFGVTSPDSRLQRPEYLGGNRKPINISQVVQQSATMSSGTPQGTTSGMSLTTDRNSDFIKSFTEHGFVIGVMVARYDHTYQQGLERMWSRKSRFDFYWPVFSNIGEQAILNKEIFATGTATDDEVFGYQEAWADYRYKPNHVCSEMRSSSPLSLDVWHLGDDYASLPSLSDDWIREDKANVDRILTITSKNTNQLFADIYIKNKCTRPMPMYSIPGLIDHF